MTYIKYPSTLHLPFSGKVQDDDGILESMNGFVGREIVVTEKMDGENTSLYHDHIHARSLDSRHHASRDWIKAFWATINYKIPTGYRICGENMFAKHSIFYEDLESYFYGFSLWNEELCFDWDETVEVFKLWGIVAPRELYRGRFDVKTLQKIASSLDVNKHEGFVVRISGRFELSNFSKHVAKWVRPNHVQTDQHWMHGQITPNKLR